MMSLLKNNFMEIRAAAKPKAVDVYIYNEISSQEFWGDEVTPQTIKDALDAVPEANEIHIYINSPGGDVFAGHTIYNIFKRHSAKKIVHVDGVAASIASIIALCGDKLVMPKNTFLMLHHAWRFAAGNAEKLRKAADDLERINESLIAIYLDKSGMKREELIAMLDAETWLSAEECLALRFADEVEGAVQVAACSSDNIYTFNGKSYDLGGYRNRPNVEVVAELPTPDHIVEVDDERIADERVAEAVNRIMNETALNRHDAIAVATAVIAVYDGEREETFLETFDRIYRGQTEENLRSARDMIDAVLAKEGEDDVPVDDAVAGELLAVEPDPRIDALLAELKNVSERVDALQASFSNAVPVMRNVESNGDKASSDKGEDVVDSLEDEEHVIVLEKEPADKEVQIEAEMLKNTIKAAFDEEMAEFKLRNMGRVD